MIGKDVVFSYEILWCNEKQSWQFPMDKQIDKTGFHGQKSGKVMETVAASHVETVVLLSRVDK